MEREKENLGISGPWVLQEVVDLQNEVHPSLEIQSELDLVCVKVAETRGDKRQDDDNPTSYRFEHLGGQSLGFGRLKAQ